MNLSEYQLLNMLNTKVGGESCIAIMIANDALELGTKIFNIKKGIEEWIKVWKKTNWKNGKIKNIDLWQLLDILNKKYKPEWNWVKGHNGNQWNEKADELANLGLENLYQ